MLRHGGPSTDYAYRVRELLEIQERGQWANVRNCQRCNNSALYQRVVADRPPAVVDKYAACLVRLPGLLRMYVRGF